MANKNIVVLMGGKSSEHDVSLISAKTVIESIDKERYSVIMVGITKDGQWKLIDTMAHLEDGSWVNSKTSAYICPDTGSKELLLERGGKTERISIDVVFSSSWYERRRRNSAGTFRVSSDSICRLWCFSFCLLYG